MAQAEAEAGARVTIIMKICRGCGALCLPQGWEERGGLCPKCAAPKRVPTPPPEPDPIRDAIDRAAADWADDNEEDPKQ